MKTVLVLVFLFFKGGVYSLTENSVNGDIRNVAVGNGKVFVVTDSQIIQMKHDLVVEERRDISNHTHPNTVTILLSFHTNKTLITCGTSECGYCEVLDLNNISTSIYRENTLAVPFVDESSVSFLVDFYQSATETGSYMLVAREKDKKNNQKPQNQNCAHNGVVTLWNTLHSQHGDIFSKIGPLTDTTDYSISLGGDVEWVDGFQTSSPSHSYLLVNVQSGTTPAVIVLKMENSNRKSDMIKFLHGSELQCCDDKPRQKLLSSSVVISSGSPLYWVGVFTAHEDPENTVLAIYDLSQITNQVPSQLSCSPRCRAKRGDAVLTPRAVVLKYNSITSVAAEKKGFWNVIYIGTANGQLMKMVLDKEFRSSCVTVLYRSDDDTMVFPRMTFDPVDHKYIYIALRNQIRRVALTQCGMYGSLRDCRASRDPFCGWCVTTSMCSTNEECSDSSWISIPEDSINKDLITFQISELSTKVTLSLQMSLKGTYMPYFTCTFKTEDKILCNNPDVVFPNCFCSFSSQNLPTKVTVTIMIGNQKITENINLRSCPDITDSSPYAVCVACFAAGCYWSSTSKKCSWTHDADIQVHMQDVCNGLSSGIMTPEIVSVEPNQLSSNGRNNAVIKGKNLALVKKIRFQGFMECFIKETPVLEHSSDTLKFNIPSGNKGNKSVCLVTVDGQCHSSATITYVSMTTCTELQPTVTWASGGRMIEVLGTGLTSVDKIEVNKKESRISQRSEKLWFYSPPLLMGYGYFSVSLRRGKSSVVCADKLSYLPDPEFISFSTSLYLNDVQVFINKKSDRLDVREEDVKVWGLQENKQFECLVEKVISTAIVCNILRTQEFSIDVDSLRISLGYFSTVLKTRVKNTHSLFCVKELS